MLFEWMSQRVTLLKKKYQILMIDRDIVDYTKACLYKKYNIFGMY